MNKILLIAGAALCVAATGLSAERPWLVVNEDNDHFFKFDSSWMDEKGLTEYVDKVAQGHVTHFFMCVNGQRTSYDSKTWEPIWTNLETDRALEDTATGPNCTLDRWAVNAKKLFDQGIDPYAVWTKRCREKGVSPWVSMRMNDVHFMPVTNYFRNTSFCKGRSDLWRVPDGPLWDDRALDFAQREVREYALAQVREIAARWDVDGVELDWMRFGYHLRPNRERADAKFLTDFMRTVRWRLREISRQKGRTIRLAVRLPRDPALGRAIGYDLDTWVRENLMDVVIGSSFLYADFDLPVAKWIKFLKDRGSNIRFLPAIDAFTAPDAGGGMTPACYRGIADRFYKGGATGLYLFNAPYKSDGYGEKGNHELGGSFGTICREGLAPETVAAGEKTVLATKPDFPRVGAPRNVPLLMRTFGGTPVKTVADWEKRREEIREKFLSQMYGRRPAGADKPSLLKFEPAEPDKVMMDGKAVRKRIRCTYGGPYGETNFVFTAFIPKVAKPAPAFLLICNRDPKENLDPERAVKSGFWPAERIVERGYAAIAFWNGDITRDYCWDFQNGVFGIFQRNADRTRESWGILSAWAWGASRVMDWIETEPTLDAKHVGVVGHSRGGKTALFAGVSDTRFAMTCSNCSGCGGAKLNHMEMPESEHIDQIWDAIGCWFCNNFEQYRCREDEMDFDQHMWAALVAPRLLAIASASEDNWAGQQGEFQTGKFASPAWELYGQRGLVGKAFPGADKPLQDGSISYHMRTGEHNLTPYDWDRYMDFADRNGWRGN